MKIDVKQVTADLLAISGLYPEADDLAISYHEGALCYGLGNDGKLTILTVTDGAVKAIARIGGE